MHKIFLYLFRILTKKEDIKRAEIRSLLSYFVKSILFAIWLIMIAPTIKEANSPIAVVNQVRKNGKPCKKYNSAAIVTIEIEKKIAK